MLEYTIIAAFLLFDLWVSWKSLSDLRKLKEAEVACLKRDEQVQKTLEFIRRRLHGAIVTYEDPRFADPTFSLEDELNSFELPDQISPEAEGD